MSLYAQMQKKIDECKKEEDEQLRRAHELAEKENPDTFPLEHLFHPLRSDERIVIMRIPQHISALVVNPFWILKRFHTLSGSKIGGTTGNNKYSSVFKELKHMLWPSVNKVNKVACNWGNTNEDRCENKLILVLRKRVNDPNDPLVNFKIYHCGIVKELHCFGYSPDGFVQEWYMDGTTAIVLVEYKCPYSKRFMSPPVGQESIMEYKDGYTGACLYGPIEIPLPLKNPIHPRKPFPQPEGIPKDGTAAITPYYYDQIIWGMDLMMRCGILKTHPVHVPVMKCYFMVWTPKFSQLSVVYYNKRYAAHVRRCAEFFIRELYIPSARLKRERKLDFGTIPPFVKKLDFH